MKTYLEELQLQETVIEWSQASTARKNALYTEIRVLRDRLAEKTGKPYAFGKLNEFINAYL